jgi:hypothetical protein
MCDIKSCLNTTFSNNKIPKTLSDRNAVWRSQGKKLSKLFHKLLKDNPKWWTLHDHFLSDLSRGQVQHHGAPEDKSAKMAELEARIPALLAISSYPGGLISDTPILQGYFVSQTWNHAWKAVYNLNAEHLLPPGKSQLTNSRWTTH